MSGDVWADGATAKAQLGRVGVWLGPLGQVAWADARGVAQRIEELGYGALWISETPSAKEAFSHAGLLLGATERLSVGTGIANIWARDATAMRNAALALADAHPGRFTAGIGVSHRPAVAMRGHDYAKPLTAMRAYLDGIDATPWAGPVPAEPVPLVLAALRPRMLELARDRTAGAHPYFVPAEHTARARAALGGEPLLAPEVAVVLEADPSVARARARRYAKLYLALPNYTNNLRDLGYTDEDLAGDGSDRLIDAVIPWGDEATIARRVAEHHEAGADHVCVQPVGTDVAGALRELERLAPALLG
jgi:probable F420-dependent oxidoreductase